MRFTDSEIAEIMDKNPSPHEFNRIPTAQEWKVSGGRLIVGGQVMPIVAPDTAGYAEAQSNNHLISAAKEMQAMLIRLLGEVMMDEAVFSKIAPLTLEQSRMAIAKSKGGI